jgi:hypothetical protein
MVNSTLVNLQGMTTAQFSLYPNPTSGDVNLVVNGNYDINQIFQIELISPDGKLIKTYKGDLSTVSSDLSSAISDCATGVYFVRVVSNDAQMIRLVIE